MAETVAELEIRIRADLNRLRSDLNKAKQATGSTSKRMAGHFKKVAAAAAMIKRNIAGIVTVLAAVTVGKMAMMAKEAISAADALGKTASKLGISVSALQELQYAANQSGVKIETLNMGLQRFGRRAAEAAAGTGEARDALKKLNISLVDGHGKLRTTEELFMDAISALGGVASPLERVRLAFKLFDSEGVAMVNMAGKTKALRAEAQALGLVLSDEVIAKSTKTKDTMEMLSRMASNQLAPALIHLGGDVLIAVAESFAELAGWVNKTYRHMVDIKNLGLTNAQAKLKEQLEPLTGAYKDYSEALEIVNRWPEEHQRGRAWTTANEDLTSARNLYAGLSVAIGETVEQIELLSGARADEAKSGADAGPDGSSQTVAEMQKGVADRKALAQEVHDHLLQLRGEDIQLAKEAADRKLAILRGATKEELTATNNFAQVKKDIADGLEIEIAEINRASAEEIKGIRDGLTQGYLQSIGKEEEAVKLQLANDISALREHVKNKLLTHAQYLEDKKKLEAIASAEIKDIQDQAIEDQKKLDDEKKQQWEDLNKFIVSGFNDALATMLLDGEFTFKALADAFLREFVKIGIARTTASLFSGFETMFSNVGNTGSIAMNTTGTNPYSSYAANGGPISGATLVGERGPELFIPKTSGFIATNYALSRMSSKGGGGGVSVTVINNTGQESSTTEKDGPDGNRAIEVMIGKAISSNISRGGDVDQAIRNSYGVNRVGRHGI